MNESAAFLELIDITRRFPGIVALDGVSLTLRAGEVHALVGENGAGKSTLINVVSGLLMPDGGQMLFRGQPAEWTNPVAVRKQGIVTVHQEAELFAPLSVAENMALEQGLPVAAFGWVRWQQVFVEARRAVALLAEPLDVARPAARLSVAQRHMAQIAAAVAHRARVLVLDEPTSALSGGEAEWLFRQIARLKADGVGILYVSHRQEEIFQLADRITVLRDGRRAWTGRSEETDRAELIRQMVGRSRSETASAATVPPLSRESLTTPRLRVAGLTSHDNRFSDVSLDARAGEIVGIYGLIGSGRSEFAQAIFGLRRSRAGSVQIDGQIVTIRSPSQAVAAGVAYVPEDRLRQGVFRGLSVRANSVVSALRSLAPVL